MLLNFAIPLYVNNLHNITPSKTQVAIATRTILNMFSSMAYVFVVAKLEKVSILPLIFVLVGIGNLIIGLVAIAR